MIVNTGKKQYKIVRDVFCGKVNDVYICQEIQTSIMEHKTLWMIKDRAVAKKILQEFDTGKEEKNQIYLECFMYKDNMCFTFPYQQERPLEKFYVSTVKGGICSREQILMELVVQCMTSILTEPILKMILLQNQMQLSTDGAIYFTYFLDLSEYPDQNDKQESVVICAKKIISLLRLENNPKDTAYRLLERKLERAEYTQYLQLYKDMKLLTQQKDRSSFKKNVQKWYGSKKDIIYHVISRASVLLLTIVVFMLIMRIVLGDFALYQLFSGPIVQIGTESLLK